MRRLWWWQARRKRLKAYAAWEAERRHQQMWMDFWAAMHQAITEPSWKRTS